MMKFIRLIALNLALFPTIADRVPWLPVLSFLFVALNLVGIQAFLISRPLGTFHCAFLAVGTVSSTVLTIISASWSEPWKVAASASGVLLAGVGGLHAARHVRPLDETSGRRARAILAFFHGAVIGFAIFAAGATAAAWVIPESPSPHTARWYVHLLGLIACPVLCGMCVLHVRRNGQKAVRIGVPRGLREYATGG